MRSGSGILWLLIPTLTRNRGEMAAFLQNWKHEPPHLTMERWLGIWPNTNSVVILSARQSNKWNVSIEKKCSRNSTAQTRGVCRRTHHGQTEMVHPHRLCGEEGATLHFHSARLHTMHSESIQTPRLFPHFVTIALFLNGWNKISSTYKQYPTITSF